MKHKIILFIFFISILSSTNLLADEFDDCLDLESLRSQNEGSNFSEAFEHARKICSIRVKLGWDTKVAKDFDICIKKERLKKIELTYSKLIENSIETCSYELKEAENIRTENEKQKRLEEERKYENKLKKSSKEIEKLRQDIEELKREEENNTYYHRNTGSYIGYGFRYDFATIKFPKSQSLLGVDTYLGNSYRYSGLGVEFSIGYVGKKSRFYLLFSNADSDEGGITQTGSNNPSIKIDYDNLHMENISFNADYFFSKQRKSFFIGGGFSMVRSQLAFIYPRGRVYWTNSHGERIYINRTILFEGLLPFIKIGYTNEKLEISYTINAGTLKKNAIFGIISDSGASDNPNVYGPYNGDLEFSSYSNLSLIWKYKF